MEVFGAVQTVLAVRAYQDRPVPPDTVRRIVEAGRLTGSASNRQPWQFIVVEDRDTLAQLAAVMKSGPYIVQAPLAVVVVIERTRLAESDGSRAIQSMVLTAWSEGIGSNWVGYMAPDETKAILGVPGDLDVLAVVVFGYPLQPVGKGKKRRKALSEVAHRERFGQAF